MTILVTLIVKMYFWTFEVMKSKSRSQIYNVHYNLLILKVKGFCPREALLLYIYLTLRWLPTLITL